MFYKKILQGSVWVSNFRSVFIGLSYPWDGGPLIINPIYTLYHVGIYWDLLGPNPLLKGSNRRVKQRNFTTGGVGYRWLPAKVGLVKRRVLRGSRGPHRSLEGFFGGQGTVIYGIAWFFASILIGSMGLVDFPT